MNKFLLAVRILVLVIVFVTLALNAFLSIAKNQLVYQIEKYFTEKISIGRIIYLPPGLIFLQDVSFDKTTSIERKPSILIPSATIKLSMRELIMNRRLFVSEIYCYKPKINYQEFALFLKENFQQIILFIRSLPQQDIKLFFKRAELDLTKTKIGPKYIAADLTLIIKGGCVLGFGSINKNMFGTITPKFPVNYSFKAFLTYSGFTLEKLEFNRHNFSSQLKGSYEQGILKLSGFAIANSLQAKLFILDIDCQANFRFPKLQINHLTFSLNNNPVNLRGSFLFSDPLLLDLVISSYLTNFQYEQAENIKKAELKITGAIKDGIFNSDATLNLESLPEKKGILPSESLELELKGFNLDSSNYPGIKLRIGESSLLLQKGENKQKVALTNFNIVFRLASDKLKFLEFNSGFYDGFLKGRAWINITKWPPRVNALVRLRDVSADKLESLLIYFSKFRGKLASQMYFSNFPGISLKGGMIIQNGLADNLEFFKWLADFFNLPSLKKIPFNKAASNFFVNAQGASLQEMRLESKDVSLNGYFRLGHNDLVSSKISLIFPINLLQKSAKFTPLLKLLGEDFKSLIFDFQLSGNLHKMNFQWLQSDFKTKIQDSIPNFIERRIDRNMESIIESLSSKQQK